jgi:hypothetical protein
MHNFVAIVAKREIVASVCRYKGGKEWKKWIQDQVVNCNGHEVWRFKFMVFF